MLSFERWIKKSIKSWGGKCESKGKWTKYKSSSNYKSKARRQGKSTKDKWGSVAKVKQVEQGEGPNLPKKNLILIAKFS